MSWILSLDNSGWDDLFKCLVLPLLLKLQQWRHVLRDRAKFSFWHLGRRSCSIRDFFVILQGSEISVDFGHKPKIFRAFDWFSVLLQIFWFHRYFSHVHLRLRYSSLAQSWLLIVHVWLESRIKLDVILSPITLWPSLLCLCPEAQLFEPLFSSQPLFTSMRRQ